jgi:hypothetical protein
MTTQNLNYYRHRADEELAAAERAVEPSIAQIHCEMAQRYRALANDGVSLAQPAGGPVAECQPALG